MRFQRVRRHRIGGGNGGRRRARQCRGRIDHGSHGSLLPNSPLNRSIELARENDRDSGTETAMAPSAARPASPSRRPARRSRPRAATARDARAAPTGKAEQGTPGPACRAPRERRPPASHFPPLACSILACSMRLARRCKVRLSSDLGIHHAHPALPRPIRCRASPRFPSPRGRRPAAGPRRR